MQDVWGMAAFGITWHEICFVYMMFPCVWDDPFLRHYPKEFGAALARLIDGQLPSGDLRNKVEVDIDLSDREIFARMKIQDAWWDANIPELYWYLRKLPNLVIPDSWQTTMDDFEKELRDVTCLNSYLFVRIYGQILEKASSFVFKTFLSPFDPDKKSGNNP